MDGLLLSGSLSAEITAKTVEVIQRNAQAQSALVDDTSLDGIHVLVVDDQSDARILLEVVFQQCNARVSNAASSAEALQLISNFCPDVVISDIGNRTLKSLAAGFDFHTAKPIDSAELVALVARTVRRLGQATTDGNRICDDPPTCSLKWNPIRNSISVPTPTAAKVFLFHRSGFINGELSPIDFFTVKFTNSLSRSGIVAHLNKTESLGTPGITVRDDLYGFHLSQLAEHVTEIGFSGLKREITNVNLFCHLSPLFA